MAANVDERVHFASLRSSDQHRYARVVVGKELTGLSNLSYVAHNDGEVTKQGVDFLLQAQGVGVMANRVQHDSGLHVGVPRLGVAQNGFDNIEFCCAVCHVSEALMLISD